MTYADFLRLVRDRMKPEAPYLCLLLDDHTDNPDIARSPHALRLLAEIKVLLRTDPGNVLDMDADYTVTLHPILSKRYGWGKSKYELRVMYLNERIAQEEYVK